MMVTARGNLKGTWTVEQFAPVKPLSHLHSSKLMQVPCPLKKIIKEMSMVSTNSNAVDKTITCSCLCRSIRTFADSRGLVVFGWWTSRGIQSMKMKFQ